MPAMSRRLALSSLALLLTVPWLAAPLRAADPRIAAAGDIACDPADPNFNSTQGTPSGCHMRATSDLLVGQGYDAVLLLGDNQYEHGEFANYLSSFDHTWGRVKAILRPAPGNHEYYTPGAAGYFRYFGAAAGDPARGYYSFDLGAWHVVSLNSTCSAVPCADGSAQERWLRDDLAAHPARCVLAYWHEPRFSSGPHGSDPTYDAFWRDLYAAHADVVLSGHDHDYERFAPQDPDGQADAAGMTEFVVGTGGKNLYAFQSSAPNSRVRRNDAYGVLALTLHRDGYDWQFLDAASGAALDQGSALCSPPPCLDGPQTLCLSGRFVAEASWQTPEGASGVGRARPLTADTGTFSFFDPANVELVVKVLDGCGVNGRRWVFAAGLTNLAADLWITDTASGATRHYANPQGTSFSPIQDVTAFACP